MRATIGLVMFGFHASIRIATQRYSSILSSMKPITQKPPVPPQPQEDNLAERKRKHDQGICHKAQMGYRCFGGTRNGRAYGECE